MSKVDRNMVRDARQTFNLSGAGAADGALLPKIHRAKVFKSGNSLALRLPKALGLEVGMEFDVEAGPDGVLRLKPIGQPKRKFNIDKVWGSAIGSGLQPIDEDDRWFEERPLLWDDPAWRAKHMPDA